MTTEDGELVASAALPVCEEVSGNLNVSSMVELKSGKLQTTLEVKGQHTQIAQEIKQQATQSEGKAKRTLREAVSSVPAEDDRIGRVHCEELQNVAATVSGTFESISRASGSWQREEVLAAFQNCVVGNEISFDADQIEMTTKVYWVATYDHRREVKFSRADLCGGNPESRQRILKLQRLLNIDPSKAHSRLLHHRVEEVALSISSGNEDAIHAYTAADFAAHLSEHKNSVEALLLSKLEESSSAISVIVRVQELLNSE